jgi:hypothetical protein
MAATPDGSFIDDLRVGQCYQQPKDEQTSWVEVVSCRQPHDAELFAIVPLAGQVLPAEAKLERLADQACAAQFRAYVGVASQATQLNFDWWAPTKESWASGDRTVLCELKNVDASRLVGSMHASGGRTIPELPIVKLDRTANVGVFHIHLTTMTCGYPMLAGLGAAKRGQYCIVELTATNARASSDRLSDANQRLSVATGESFKGFGFGDPLWKDELKPGQQLTTRLLFDLPRGVRPARLRLQADASQHRGQDTATINLPQH